MAADLSVACTGRLAAACVNVRQPTVPSEMLVQRAEAFQPVAAAGNRGYSSALSQLDFGLAELILGLADVRPCEHVPADCAKTGVLPIPICTFDKAAGSSRREDDTFASLRLRLRPGFGGTEIESSGKPFTGTVPMLAGKPAKMELPSSGVNRRDIFLACNGPGTARRNERMETQRTQRRGERRVAVSDSFSAPSALSAFQKQPLRLRVAMIDRAGA